ncbi:hypothetical protein A986_02316 [Pseudomonas fluorescens BRIP34879]|nr:hypothetical protein A986_02316 [Pseudomonas fluorescens BRIP34879]
MNLPRPTQNTFVLSVCLIILAGTSGYEHHQLSQLSNNLAATADKSSLDALLTRLGKVDERLDAVDGKHLVSNEDFRAGQQALSNRIDAAQAYAKQASEATQELSRDAASSGELVVLKASLETIENRLHELGQSQAKQLLASSPKPKPAPANQRPFKSPPSISSPRSPLAIATPVKDWIRTKIFR